MAGFFTRIGNALDSAVKRVKDFVEDSLEWFKDKLPGANDKGMKSFPDPEIVEYNESTHYIYNLDSSRKSIWALLDKQYHNKEKTLFYVSILSTDGYAAKSRVKSPFGWRDHRRKVKRQITDFLNENESHYNMEGNVAGYTVIFVEYHFNAVSVQS